MPNMQINMYKICRTNADHMMQICRIICTKYAEYAEYANEMQKICRKYAERMLRICQTYALKHAKNMQNMQMNMQKIC